MFETEVVEKVKTHVHTPRPKIVPFIRLRTNMAEADRPHDIVWRMHFTFRITKARMSLHYEFLILTAVPRQQ